MRKVLIIEDEAPIALLLAGVIRRAGGVAVVAFNFDQARQVLEGKDVIDAILSDIDLGLGQTGIDFAKELRDRAGFEKLPIVFLSGSYNNNDGSIEDLEIINSVTLVHGRVYSKPVTYGYEGILKSLGF